ncbi:MAG: ParA family protein [Ruminococcus sp.]|nr:ParA family protein [Ruminococcus sp.]
MGRIIAFSNQKGGVGKTTTVVNLAAALGDRGKKVLVVDFDPQGNTTTSFGIRKKSIRNTSYEAVIGQCRIVEAIVATQFKGISVVPTSQKLSGAEHEIADMDNRSARLKMQLLTVKDDYDYILIDCPPTLNLLNINALVAADGVIIPILCEYLSLEGLVEIDDTIRKIRQNFNPKLEIDGILFTMYNSRYNLTGMVVDEVKKYFPDKAFETVIPRNIALAEAPSFGEPVLYYDKKAKGTKAYEDLAKEIEKRRKKADKVK